MGGGSGGGGQIIPFNMSELAPFMPSVFNGPYNAAGAQQNESTLEAQYPWITPPAGDFAGATPGQFAGAGSGGGIPGLGISTPQSVGVTSPNAPPPATPQTNATSGQINQMGLASNQVNGMQPNSLQQILSVLGSQSPTTGNT